MKRHAGLLALIAALVWGQAVAQSPPPSAERADVMVGRLYAQVVARQPRGTLAGADRKIFAPYLSKALLHRFDLNDACIGDWLRKYPDPNLKPPGPFEDGLFSGSSEKGHPKDFHIERTEPGKDGSFRVYVKLTWLDPYDLTWYVAAVAVPENGRLVLDNVLYLKNKKGDVEYRMWDVLSAGCNGARWVGYPPRH